MSRKSGGCAVKDRVLTWGDLALCLKGQRSLCRRREVSRRRSSRVTGEGPNEKESSEAMTLGQALHQKPGIPGRIAKAKVKPPSKRFVMKCVRRVTDCKARGNLNFSNRPVRTRMPGGVAGERSEGRPLCRLGRVYMYLCKYSCARANRVNWGDATGPVQRAGDG